VVEGDLYRRETCWARVIVDFPSLLGKDGRVAADSLVLCDAAGRRIPLEVAQDSSTRSTSAGPLLWLSWECGCLAPFEDRSWQLYFRTVVPGDPAARPSLSRTFDAQQPNVVFASGFEEPQPGRPEQPLGMSPAGRDEPGEKSQRVWTDAEAHSGRRSLQIARSFDAAPPPNTNRPHWRTWPPPVEVRPGEAYRLSGWLKCARLGLRAGATVSLLFLDEKKARIPGAMARMESGTQPHDWQLVATTAVAPAAARFLEIGFSLHGEGDVYCDDLALSVVPGSRLSDPMIRIGSLQRRAGAGPK
jgi:hypothetical protein